MIKKIKKSSPKLKRKVVKKRKTAKPKPKPKAKKKLRRIAKPKTKKRLIKKTGLIRSESNPIIQSLRENFWEAWQTFNPGVILLNDNVHFIYRAIGQDGMSRFGYARSSDGFTLTERFSDPIYEHRTLPHSFNYYSFASGGSFGGAEDPRVVRVGEENTLYVTYTVCNGGLQVGLTSIKVADFLQKRWNWRPPVLISPPGETHKNWVIFPEKINGKYAILHSISPKIGVAYFDSLEFDGRTYIKSSHNGKCECEYGCRWEDYVRGVGAPPIKTRYGWLVFYHALEKNDSGKYKVGAMLLDLNDPTKILCRSRKPILEPNEAYENKGFKPGVVYVSGAVVKDGKLLVYYGGADSYVNLAHADLEEFLKDFSQTQRPKLKRVTAKTKINT